MIKGIDYTGIAVVFFCHDGNGRYLMHRRTERARDEHGCWDVGGGGVEHGESLEDALRREIKEEYDADVFAHEYLGFREVHRVHDGAPTHWIVFDFKALVDPSQVGVGESQECHELGWFPITEHPTPAHSQLPQTIEKYKELL